MKILWYVNIVMPKAAQHFRLKATVGGGWLISQADAIKDKVSLYILSLSPLVKEVKQAEIDGINYIIAPSKKGEYLTEFKNIINEITPDIVHIYGTEYVYNTNLIHLCNDLNQKYVVSLQGIMSLYAEKYDKGLPNKFNKTPWYINVMDKVFFAQGIAREKQKFIARGEKETIAMQGCKNVIGRTHWDKAYAIKTNPNINYFHVNESLRAEFYNEPKWQQELCDKNTIFVSQADYPIKGFHMLLSILTKLKKIYPNIHINVGGRRGYSLNNAFLDKFVDMFFQYQKYIKQLIKQNQLSEQITFTGPLNATQMKEQYLKASLFLSCSTVENSPNSVGEAMLLGMPIVSSDVGGVSTMLADKKEGLLYPFDDTAKMLQSICDILDNPENAKELGQKAKIHGTQTHDSEKNTQALLNAYKEIIENAKSV